VRDDWGVHAILSVKEGLPSLRQKKEVAAIRESLRRCGDKEGFRVVQNTILSNHVHLVVEADDKEHLELGMTGLITSMAKSLNRVWQTKGSVFDGRYFARVLKTPREMRQVLEYVLHNAARHGLWRETWKPDPFSSAPWFDGWEDYRLMQERPGWIAAAKSWLVRVGWRRAGPIRLAVC
jgi:REP element-mobilizing transposase RayT